MYVKKIVTKNFIVPGVQKFEFDSLGGLVDGAFFNLDVIDQIKEILNGAWVDSTLSFEKYYPKFSYPAQDMTLELDALIQLTEMELDEFNKILLGNGHQKTTNQSWFYTVKAYYPYIFPIVTLAPAKDDGTRDLTKMVGIGNHYEKFLRSNSTKRDILSVAAFYCVSKMRETYYDYKLMHINEEALDLHNEYLKLLKSVFRYDEQFIKKVGKIFYTIDDGDVLNYGDQMEFFTRHPEIVQWFDSIEILRESPEIRHDFSKLMWDYLFSNLQIDYTVKTSNEVIEIKNLLVNSNCLRPIEYRQIAKLFKLNLADEPLEIFSTKKQSIEPNRPRRYRMEDTLNIDEDTMNLLNEFEDLTIRQEKIAEVLDAEIKDSSKSKQDKKLKKVKATKKDIKEKNIDSEKVKKARLEQKAEIERMRKARQKERDLRHNPKVVVIDSEHVTKDLIRWD